MARKTRKQYMMMALRRVGTDEYGDDYISAGATAVTIQTKGITITPFAGEEIDRALDDGGMGNSPQILAGTHVKLTGSVELAGAGAIDSAVKYSPLLQICGRNETLEADKVIHSRILDDSNLDATIIYYKDGALHTITGARGKIKITAKAKELSYFEFEITGLYGGISKTAFATPDLTGWTKPEKVGRVFSSFTLAGQALKLIDFEADDGNEINYVEYIGYEEVLISDWKPNGKITIEAPDLDTFNPFTVSESESQIAIELIHGTVAGNIVAIGSKKIQLGRPEYGDQNGTLTYSIPFKFIEDFTITTR